MPLIIVHLPFLAAPRLTSHEPSWLNTMGDPPPGRSQRPINLSDELPANAWRAHERIRMILKTENRWVGLLINRSAVIEAPNQIRSAALDGMKG